MGFYLLPKSYSFGNKLKLCSMINKICQKLYIRVNGFICRKKRLFNTGIQIRDYEVLSVNSAGCGKKFYSVFKITTTKGLSFCHI